MHRMLLLRKEDQLSQYTKVSNSNSGGSHKNSSGNSNRLGPNDTLNHSDRVKVKDEGNLSEEERVKRVAGVLNPISPSKGPLGGFHSEIHSTNSHKHPPVHSTATHHSHFGASSSSQPLSATSTTTAASVALEEGDWGWDGDEFGDDNLFAFLLDSGNGQE